MLEEPTTIFGGVVRRGARRTHTDLATAPKARYRGVYRVEDQLHIFSRAAGSALPTATTPLSELNGLRVWSIM